MKERQELVCSILSLPVLMTYHINIIYYPKEYCSMELDNILTKKILILCFIVSLRN